MFSNELMISNSMRVSDILLHVQSKELSYLLPLKKIACNLVDMIYYLFLKINWEGGGVSAPLLCWKLGLEGSSGELFNSKTN